MGRPGIDGHAKHYERIRKVTQGLFVMDPFPFLLKPYWVEKEGFSTEVAFELGHQGWVMGLTCREEVDASGGNKMCEKCAKKKKKCKTMGLPAVLWGNIQEGGEETRLGK